MIHSFPFLSDKILILKNVYVPWDVYSLKSFVPNVFLAPNWNWSLVTILIINRGRKGKEEGLMTISNTKVEVGKDEGIHIETWNHELQRGHTLFDIVPKGESKGWEARLHNLRMSWERFVETLLTLKVAQNNLVMKSFFAKEVGQLTCIENGNSSKPLWGWSTSKRSRRSVWFHWSSDRCNLGLWYLHVSCSLQ